LQNAFNRTITGLEKLYMGSPEEYHCIQISKKKERSTVKNHNLQKEKKSFLGKERLRTGKPTVYEKAPRKDQAWKVEARKRGKVGPVDKWGGGGWFLVGGNGGNPKEAETKKESKQRGVLGKESKAQIVKKRVAKCFTQNVWNYKGNPNGSGSTTDKQNHWKKKPGKAN